MADQITSHVLTQNQIRYRKRRQYYIDYAKTDKAKEAARVRYHKKKKQYGLQRLEVRKKQRLEIVDYLGGKCCKCGFTDIRALQIDHVNGNGREDRRQYKSNQIGFYNRFRTDKSGAYQLLCANCNAIKRIENR